MRNSNSFKAEKKALEGDPSSKRSVTASKHEGVENAKQALSAGVSLNRLQGASEIARHLV